MSNRSWRPSRAPPDASTFGGSIFTCQLRVSFCPCCFGWLCIEWSAGFRDAKNQDPNLLARPRRGWVHSPNTATAGTESPSVPLLTDTYSPPLGSDRGRTAGAGPAGQRAAPWRAALDTRQTPCAIPCSPPLDLDRGAISPVCLAVVGISRLLQDRSNRRVHLVGRGVDDHLRDQAEGDKLNSGDEQDSADQK